MIFIHLIIKLLHIFLPFWWMTYIPKVIGSLKKVYPYISLNGHKPTWKKSKIVKGPGYYVISLSYRLRVPSARAEIGSYIQVFKYFA